MVDNSHATKVSFCIHQLKYLAATSRVVERVQVSKRLHIKSLFSEFYSSLFRETFRDFNFCRSLPTSRSSTPVTAAQNIFYICWVCQHIGLFSENWPEVTKKCRHKRNWCPKGQQLQKFIGFWPVQAIFLAPQRTKSGLFQQRSGLFRQKIGLSGWTNRYEGIGAMRVWEGMRDSKRGEGAGRGEGLWEGNMGYE